jgi:hypothetical protein
VQTTHTKYAHFLEPDIHERDGCRLRDRRPARAIANR